MGNALEDVTLRRCHHNGEIPLRGANPGDQVTTIQNGGIGSLINGVEPIGREVLALNGHKIVIGCRWNEYGELDIRAFSRNVKRQVRVDDHRESADRDHVQRMRRLAPQISFEVFRDTVPGDQIRLAQCNGIRDSLRSAQQSVVRDTADRLHIAGSEIDLPHELDVLRRAGREVGLRQFLRVFLELA